MRTELDASGLAAIEARLRRLSEPQTERLLGQLGEEELDATRRRIRITEQSPDGAPWPALTPEYAQRTADPSDFLQDSDALLSSLQALVQGEEVAIGSALPYAGSLQRGRRNARPYLGVGEDEAEELELIAATFLEASLGAEAGDA